MFLDLKTITVTEQREMFYATIDDTPLIFRFFNADWISIVTDFDSKHLNHNRRLRYTFNNNTQCYNHFGIGCFFYCSTDKKLIIEHEKQIQEFSYNFIGV